LPKGAMNSRRLMSVDPSRGSHSTCWTVMCRASWRNRPPCPRRSLGEVGLGLVSRSISDIA
jgi:hypothetical protein